MDKTSPFIGDIWNYFTESAKMQYVNFWIFSTCYFFKKSLTIFIGYLTDFQRNHLEFHFESMFWVCEYRIPLLSYPEYSEKFI